MMNVKISQKHDKVYYIRKNYMLKSIYDDENECINYTLSHPPTQIIASPVAMEITRGYNGTNN